MSTALDIDLLKEVEQFVYREARLQDEHEYDEWEALWTDDAIYWVPANGDPNSSPSSTRRLPAHSIVRITETSGNRFHSSS